MDDEYETASDDVVNDMIRDTEREIFEAGVNGHDGEDTQNQMVEDLSQVDGWDGDSLNDTEIAHRNIYGDLGTNYDRAIQMDNEVSLANQNAALREQNARLTNAYNEHVAAPQREMALAAQREQVKQQLMDKHDLFYLGNDDRKFDAFVQNEVEKQQLLQAAGADRINRS